MTNYRTGNNVGDALISRSEHRTTGPMVGKNLRSMKFVLERGFEIEQFHCVRLCNIYLDHRYLQSCLNEEWF